MAVTTIAVISIDAENRSAMVKGRPGPVPILRHVDAAPGDSVVMLVEGGQAWIIGSLGAATVVAEDMPAPSPVVIEADKTPTVVRPVWSGTWRSGAWRPDTSNLVQGDWSGRGINTGACWWGPLPASLSRAVVTLVRDPKAGFSAALSPTIALLAGTGRPSGAPSIVDTVAGPALKRGETTDWVVPTGWLERMASGEAAGIGITSRGAKTPYMILSASGAGMTMTATE